MSAPRKLRHLAEYGLLRAALVLLRLLPLDSAAALAGRLCALIGPYTRLHYRAATNLQHALADLTADEHRRILDGMWRNTGKAFAETLMLERIIADPARLDVPEKEELTRILTAEGANIGLTLHLGNWELAAKACADCGGRLAAVYRPLRNPFIDRFVWSKREALYPGGLLMKGTQHSSQSMGHATRFVIEHVRRNGHLGVVVDQVEEACPFTVPFFGREATFTPVPAMLGRRLGARLFVGRCVRVGDGVRFRFDFEELSVPRSERAETDVQQVTAVMAARFEAWIRETPEQWMWWQRRAIGGRPAGEASRQPAAVAR